jgi:hypothetical protein
MGGGMLKFITPFIVVGALLNPSKAQDAAKMKQALTNFEADLSICLAYFSIITECSSRNGDFLRLAQFATDRLTSMAAKTADALGIPPADAAQRLAINILIQRGLMQDDCSNIGFLRSRHATECMRLTLKSDAVFREYLK